MPYTYYMPRIWENGVMPNRTIRVTKAEDKELIAEAKKAKITVSALLRKKLGWPLAVMGRPPKKKE